MTKLELPGPGLDDEQWDRLRDLATSLTPNQSTWVGGYFGEGAPSAIAGAPAEPPAARHATRSLTVLYASETGTGAAMAIRVDLLQPSTNPHVRTQS